MLMQAREPEPGERIHLVPRTPADLLRHSVLVVDDDAAFAQMVVETISDTDVKAVAVERPHEAIRLVQRQHFAVAVVDLMMPDMDGLELASELHRASPATEVVMLTGQASVQSAIEGIRNELFDYLCKDSLQPARLRRAVRAAIARSELRAENRALLAGLKESTRKLQVLSELSSQLAGEPHADELLSQLVAAGRQLLEAECVRIVLAERNELGDVFIRAAHGDGEVALGGHFGAGDGIVTAVVTSRQPQRLQCAQDHPSYSPRCDSMPTRLPGFLCAPLDRPGVAGAIVAAGRERPFSEDDLSLLVHLGRQGAVAMQNALAEEESQNYFTHTCEMLVSLLDARDPQYEGHSHAVAKLADMVTRRMGLPEPERRKVHFAALLHDIGKLRLRAGILESGRSFTAEELRLVQEHPALGVEILRPISKWTALAPIIHSHHERWDGGGYPRRLRGPEIPLGGRIVAVAEAFEAMLRPAPGRSARTVEEALIEVERHAGSQFDPVIAKLFVDEYRLNIDRFTE